MKSVPMAGVLCLAAGTLTGVLAAGARAGTAGIISTVAGGAGGPAKATSVALTSPVDRGGGLPCAVSFAGGRLFIADGGSVREVNPATDRLVTLAGTGANGPLGDGSPAVNAALQTCRGTSAIGAGEVAVDHTANVLIADTLDNRIRVIPPRTGTFYGQAMTAGDIYTIAGRNGFGFTGDGGPATAAQLHAPEGVAVDRSGNVVIADTANNRIRVVAARAGTFYGQPMTTGDIYTIAGTGTAAFSGDGGPATAAGIGNPGEVKVDGAGNVLVADTGDSRVRVIAPRSGTFYGQPMTAAGIYTIAGTGTAGFSGDGGPAAAGRLNHPFGLTVDSAGNVLVADTRNNRVRLIAASTGISYGQAVTAGDIYTLAGDGTSGFSGDGSPATAAQLSQPDSVSVDGAGDLLVADSGNSRIRIVPAASGTLYTEPTTAGDIYTIAGDGASEFSGDRGPATAAELHAPEGVATDSAGDLLFADTFNQRVRMVAAAAGRFFGQSMTAGDVYTVAGDDSGGYSGDSGRATAAEVSFPQGVAFDGSGNLLIADSDNSRIRVVAAAAGIFYGQPMTAGDIYTIAGTGAFGFSGDGGPATAAQLDVPTSVAADSSGNLVIADNGNRRIRVVAASTGTFYGQPMTAGDIYAVAGDGTGGFSGDGGPATAAELNPPQAVAVDGAGNLVIADSGNERIRVVAASTGTFYGQPMTAGDIYTIAGTGAFGFSGDGGPATAANLATPEGVAVDSAGNLLIADTVNQRVRVVAGTTGTFYGQPMTAGDIYTIAGSGAEAFSGDGGPATAAGLDGPLSVAAVSAGGLVIADAANNRIREVTG